MLTVDERLGRGEGVKGVKGVAFDPEVRVLTWSMKARVMSSKGERTGDGLDSRYSKDSRYVDGTPLGTPLGTSLSTSLDTPLDTD